MSASAAWGRAEGARENTPVCISVLLCIAYCVFPRLKGSKSCSTRVVWTGAAFDAFLRAWKRDGAGGAGKETMGFLSALDSQPCYTVCHLMTGLGSSRPFPKHTRAFPIRHCGPECQTALQSFVFIFALLEHTHVSCGFRQVSSRLMFTYCRRSQKGILEDSFLTSGGR